MPARLTHTDPLPERKGDSPADPRKGKDVAVDRKDKVAGSLWHTVTEIAEDLKVSERTVRRWIAQGDLRAHRFGRAVRVSSEDLEAFERQSRP